MTNILLQSFRKRPAPERDSTSQIQARRQRRIAPEAATSSTSNLQQPDDHQEANAVNCQHNAEQIDQNLVNSITLNYWRGTSFNCKKCIELFSYLTDPTYEGDSSKFPERHLTPAATALNIWNVITDNERKYLSILARNIRQTFEAFPIQDRDRINELETTIRENRNILPDENLQITVNMQDKKIMISSSLSTL